MEWLYGTLIWKPKRSYDTYVPSTHFNQSNFSKEASIQGTFYHIHGEDDKGPIALSEVGWAEMVPNIVKMELFYDNQVEEKN